MGVLSIVAYCVFLAGAAKSFRENGSASTVRIMLAPLVKSYFDAFFTFSGVIGKSLTRAPTAFAMAFAMAGATTVVAGSPEPTG